ncbi:MAG TPA: TfoX/Sxy family protein [Beijerinckiaceae bacterium]|jgi:hypothetical protein
MMAFDESLAARVRRRLAGAPAVEEKRMMGALVFCLDGHMCCGVTGDALMVRLGEEGCAAALRRPGVRPLQIGGGRAPRAFVCVEPAAVATDADLAGWIAAAQAFVAKLEPKRPGGPSASASRAQRKQ